MIFAATCVLLVSLCADVGSEVNSENVRVYIQTVESKTPELSFEYFLKPGRLVNGTLWDTEQHSGSDTITYNIDPPRKWNKVDGVDYVDVKIDSTDQTIFVRSEGFEIASLLLPESIAQKSSIVLYLKRVENIVGRVVGPDGQGIADCRILIGSLPTKIGGWDLVGVAACTTDGDGQFALKAYPSNLPFLITTYSSKYASGYLYIDKFEKSKIQEIRLCDSARVAGKVVLSRGSIKLASVWMDVLTSRGERYASFVADVNRATGEFLVSNLPPGDARLFVGGVVPSLFLWEKEFSQEVKTQFECGKTKELEILVDTH